MNVLKSLLIGCVVAAGLCVGTCERASAADNQYAVFAIINETNATIHYQMRWGDRDWRSFTVKPGENYTHSWRYSYLNENASPRPEIRFDTRLNSSELDVRSYVLDPFASPSDSFNGARKYVFRRDGNTVNLFKY